MRKIPDYNDLRNLWHRRATLRGDALAEAKFGKAVGRAGL
jgi:hypothetical protein